MPEDYIRFVLFFKKFRRKTYLGFFVRSKNSREHCCFSERRCTIIFTIQGIGAPMKKGGDRNGSLRGEA
jgi:hypothetical protein